MPKTESTQYPRHLILGGALMSGLLMALALHMLGQNVGLDLSGLWRSDSGSLMPASAALAWWLVATGGFAGGYFTARLMDHAAAGQIPPKLRQFLIVVLVLVLAAAGQAASAPSTAPSAAGVIAGLVTLLLGAAMAFCGAYFALRKV
ncbi:hypothetical protein BJ123_105181 [Rhodopseudomonas thermotolerans]|jgi:hypothetical protein|uniref:Uncharacterized protein n=2 Tax=Rhodopseudomonas TaxID=1073 RepID=A0A336JKB9_9BRAD|nr:MULTISPECIES: hypothetical protein [Rhodopseudomonas]RED38102.1 hypothetical protein BJ125_105181 [Rhodopseudomonas pentothenatexigens]REG05295.1 hypothetical protein BJ123_105181 [Rhodopseudomonas thermotolerans]SSW90127.1 hypothetical protein SAMN05892882_105181 [Rhodopseudomonas pentothenatexigens]